VETGDLFASHAAREGLRSLNPVSQVPTLVLPDSQVMTESAAIALHLADLSGRDGLVPGPATSERAVFLRWLVFLVANIYPTFTYADDPSCFVKDEAARAGFRAQCDALRAAALAGGRDSGRCAVVPRPAAVCTGLLLRFDDTMATGPRLVRRTRPARPGRRRASCRRSKP
jgi:Glutathione S-transferase, N-terminal domain